MIVPCCKVRNSASLSYLALFGKYFSKNYVLKLAQVTRSSRVCISCCIPTHQYSASTTRRNVPKVNFCASVHPSARHIFSHSLSHASTSSRVVLPVNLVGLCLMKSSIVTGRVGATLALGCAALGCIASTIRWIACAVSSSPVLSLLLLFAKACAHHISAGLNHTT